MATEAASITIKQIQEVCRFIIERVDDWQHVVPEGQALSILCTSFEDVIGNLVDKPNLPIHNELKTINKVITDTKQLISKFLKDDTMLRESIWDEGWWKIQRIYLAYQYREDFKSVKQQLETSRLDLMSKLEFSITMKKPIASWYKETIANDVCFQFWLDMCGEELYVPNWSTFAYLYQRKYNQVWDDTLMERIRRETCSGQDTGLTMAGYISLIKKCGFPLDFNQLPQLLHSHTTISAQTRMEVARMINELITYYSTKEMRDLLVAMYTWFKGYNKHDKMVWQARANQWGETMLAIRNKSLDEMDHTDHLAEQVDMARRTYSFFFQRYMVVFKIGQLSKTMFKEVDFPGKARMHEFIDFVKPLDKANYLIVIHGKEEEWESKQPKVYTFLDDYLNTEKKAKKKQEQPPANSIQEQAAARGVQEETVIDLDVVVPQHITLQMS